MKKKRKKTKVFMMMNTGKQKQTTKKKKSRGYSKRKTNSKREEKSVNPEHQDQSKRLRWHRYFNSTNVFSMSSKERQFHSIHTIHIKQPGIKFQVSEYDSLANDANIIILTLLNVQSFLNLLIHDINKTIS